MAISLLKDASTTNPTILSFSDPNSLIDYLSDKSVPEDLVIHIYKDAIYFDIKGLGEFCIDNITTAYHAMYLLSICYNITLC